MDGHERAAVERRLREVNAAIEAIPKGTPRPAVVDRWRNLLDEKEHLEEKLADGSALHNV